MPYFEVWNWKSRLEYVWGAHLGNPTYLEKFTVWINWKGVHGINILFREMEKLTCEALYSQDIYVSQNYL